MGALEEAAEIFFAGLDEGAFAGVEADHGFVFDGEALEFDDADIFAALFPDLTLTEFHERGGRRGEGTVSPDKVGRDSNQKTLLLFLLGGLLGGGFFSGGFFGFGSHSYLL